MVFMVITDLEQEIWEELGGEEENTIYENLPTLDMSGISKINLGKIQQFYERNTNINIVFHCYCGKGRTGNAILFLILYNNLFRDYNCNDVFPFETYYEIMRDNFHELTTQELFRIQKSEFLDINKFSFFLNLFIDRLNKINTYIGRKENKDYYLYKKFVKDQDHWIKDQTIQEWLDHYKRLKRN